MIGCDAKRQIEIVHCLQHDRPLVFNFYFSVPLGIFLIAGTTVRQRLNGAVCNCYGLPPAGTRKLRLKVNLKIIRKITNEKFDAVTYPINASPILGKKNFFGSLIFTMHFRPWHRMRKNKTKGNKVQVFVLAWTVAVIFAISYCLARIYQLCYGRCSCPMEWTQEHALEFSPG